MDINNIGASLIRERALREAATETRRAESGGEETAKPVSVDLSGDAAELARLEQDVRALPAVDEARVESIRQQIADGQYPIDADRLARNIIALERELSA